MKKRIDFGKIDFENKGKVNSAYIDIELKEKDEGEALSICGGIWNARHTDLVCGGQCLDDMKPFFEDNALFNKIYRLWKEYHLNDMHAECEHQHALGWHNLARKQIIFNIYTLNIETITQQHQIEREAKIKLLNGESVKLTDNERKIMNLEYKIKTDEPLSENLSKYYNFNETETKTLGWLREDEHKDGLLCRRCPVCDYGYGTSWKFFAIPQKDLELIKNIINGGQE